MRTYICDDSRRHEALYRVYVAGQRVAAGTHDACRAVARLYGHDKPAWNASGERGLEYRWHPHHAPAVCIEEQPPTPTPRALRELEERQADARPERTPEGCMYCGADGHASARCQSDWALSERAEWRY